MRLTWPNGMRVSQRGEAIALLEWMEAMSRADGADGG